MSDPQRKLSSRSNVAHRLIEFGDLVLSDERAFTRRGQWRPFFDSRIGTNFDGKIIFEIGCANAEFLAHIAQQNPTTAFIGLDWKYKSIFDAGTRANSLGLKNVSLIRGRGHDIARVFAPHELNEVWLFHPDPNDKPKELANRLINDTFMIDLHESLQAGSSFCFKTDHAGYYRWILAMLGIAPPKWFFEKIEGSPRIRKGDLIDTRQLPPKSKAIFDRFKVTHHSVDFWNDPLALKCADTHAFARVATPFEQRFIKKRLPIYYVELVTK